MTNNSEVVEHTGHLYNGGGIAKDSFASVLDHESGLVLVVGNAGSGKTTLLNFLVDYEKTEGQQREVLSLNEGQNEINNVDHFVIPTWNNQPNLREQYKSYSDWAAENALDAVDALMERVYDHNPGVVVIDEILNAEVGTIAVALARQGYLVVAGIHGQSAENGKESFSNALKGSNTFEEYGSGYEEISGYDENIVDRVLEETLHISLLENATPADRFTRKIVVESYESE